MDLEMLSMLVEGDSALRRFRNVIDQVGHSERWPVFSDDRRYGRTRQLLAEEGITVGGLHRQ